MEGKRLKLAVYYGLARVVSLIGHIAWVFIATRSILELVQNGITPENLIGMVGFIVILFFKAF